MFPNPDELVRQILSQVQPALDAAATHGAQSIYTSSSTSAASVSLTASCDDGRATASVLLTDATGTGIAGVPVQGSVQFSTGGRARTIRFPGTDAAGRSQVSVETVRRVNLVWTVHLEVGGTSVKATTSTSTS